jgi:hypothetical protein
VLEASFSPDAQFVLAGIFPFVFMSSFGYSGPSSVVALMLGGLFVAKGNHLHRSSGIGRFSNQGH